MARRLGKRKQPSKEKHPIHEQRKLEEVITDERTLSNLRKLFTRGIVSELCFVISTGKEADVYLARAGKALEKETEFAVIKVFRMETSAFERRVDYITGDPRFASMKGGIHSMVNTWCKKEYANLKLAHEAGVSVPKPYSFVGNMLGMELICDESGVPSRMLRKVALEDPEETLSKILDNVKKLSAVELVHADLSEYNILMKGDEPYLIDLGQAVMRGHPMYKEFMERDITNILYYFNKKYGVERDREETIAQML